MGAEQRSASEGEPEEPQRLLRHHRVLDRVQADRGQDVRHGRDERQLHGSLRSVHHGLVGLAGAADGDPLEDIPRSGG